jgi:hypothetical protein
VDGLDVRPDSVVNVKFVLLKRGNGSLAVDVRDSTGALGFANAMKDLKQATQKGGMLYVFALPEAAAR